MKILVTSDLHGNFPKIDTKFDLLLICGDICPAFCHTRNFQKEWLNDEFAEWVKSLQFNNSASRVVVIAGNHDFVFENCTKTFINALKTNCGGRLVYLDNELYVHEHIDDETGAVTELKIFGTPYCKIFGNWAFMRCDLDKYYEVIPVNADIVMSHDAAQIEDLGLISQGWQFGKDVGNPVLAKYIAERKPKYYFCGHIHSGSHDFRERDGIMSANVSYIDEMYAPSYPVLEFEINADKECVDTSNRRWVIKKQEK